MGLLRTCASLRDLSACYFQYTLLITLSKQHCSVRSGPLRTVVAMVYAHVISLSSVCVVLNFSLFLHTRLHMKNETSSEGLPVRLLLGSTRLCDNLAPAHVAALLHLSLPSGACHCPPAHVTSHLPMALASCAYRWSPGHVTGLLRVWLASCPLRSPPAWAAGLLRMSLFSCLETKWDSKLVYPCSTTQLPNPI